MNDLKRIGLDPEQVKELTRLKPLDRGKVLEWRESREIKAPAHRQSLFDDGWNNCLEHLEIEINSGRLDVEEG